MKYLNMNFVSAEPLIGLSLSSIMHQEQMPLCPNKPLRLQQPPARLNNTEHRSWESDESCQWHAVGTSVSFMVNLTATVTCRCCFPDDPQLHGAPRAGQTPACSHTSRTHGYKHKHVDQNTVRKPHRASTRPAVFAYSHFQHNHRLLTQT